MLSLFSALSLPGPTPNPWSIGAYVVLVLVLLWIIQRRAYGLPQRPRPTQPSDPDTAPTDESGSVYVLSNPEHPGLVKIGYTTRTPKERARELSASTGVPRPFEVEYEATVSHPRRVERAVHQTLNPRMVNPDREFFEVSVRTAIRTIRRVADVDDDTSVGGWPLFGLSSVIPRWLQTRLETGLGVLFMGGSAFSAVALVIHSTAPVSGPASWTRTHAENLVNPGPALLESVPEGLTDLFAALGHAIGPDFLGYCGLLPVGVVGLWGYALVRHRPLRPLRRPTIFAATAAVAVAGPLGWLVHRAQETSSSWTGGAGTADALQSWCGAVGTAAAGELRNHLGPTGALLFFVVLLIGLFLLGVRWALPRSGLGSS